MIEGRSDGGNGFRSPKNVEGLGARDTGRVFTLDDLGLDATLGSTVGLKELAAGFGLNSKALTLNLADSAEVGLRTPFVFCGLVVELAWVEGLVGGTRASCIGRGAGTETATPALCILWLSCRRWLSRPCPGLED